LTGASGCAPASSIRVAAGAARRGLMQLAEPRPRGTAPMALRAIKSHEDALAGGAGGAGRPAADLEVRPTAGVSPRDPNQLAYQIMLESTGQEAR
jgi:hypothetical protein